MMGCKQLSKEDLMSIGHSIEIYSYLKEEVKGFMDIEVKEYQYYIDSIKNK